MTNNQTNTLIRWKNDVNTLVQIDSICDEHNCSRAKAIKMVFDRLLQIDTSLFDPLNISPKILEH
jgi:hypothetical protein